MRFVTLPAVAAAFLALAACSEEEVVCTTEAAYSVNVQVFDADGAPIPDATVTYSVDGEAFAPCENFGSGDYACGIEETGAFEIAVEHDGMEDTAQLDLEADECHVIAQSVDFDLVP